MFSIELTGDWAKYKGLKRSLAQRFSLRIQTFLLQEALVMHALVTDQFPTQGKNLWKPLSPWTIAGRKMRGFAGTKALIRTGQLFRSFSAMLDPTTKTAFCGVLYQTRGKDGKSFANLAKLHEYGHPGIVIKITPKMRRFMFVLAKFAAATGGVKKRSKGGGKGKGMLVIKIPARPFMAPSRRLYLTTDIMGRTRRFFMSLLDYPKPPRPKKPKEQT